MNLIRLLNSDASFTIAVAAITLTQLLSVAITANLGATWGMGFAACAGPFLVLVLKAITDKGA